MGDTQYFNKLTNCIDPGKDAEIIYNKSTRAHLTEKEHGDFLRDKVLDPLFNLSGLTAADRKVILGVGDRKGILIDRINSTIRLNDLERHPLTRLSFDAAGNDPRSSGLQVAHDAGLGPEKLFTDYTLVLTPAGILDPAGRDQMHQPQINMIESASSLDPALLTEIDMNNALTSIDFLGFKGGQYGFEIRTSIPRFERFKVAFNRKFEETGSTLFAGNATKNKFIAENYTKPAAVNEIKARVLMKELGDTLQVQWLKHIIQSNQLEKDKTAILSCDKVVWLRSILNGVSCILTEGNVVTFYPVAGSELQKAAAQAFLKGELLKDLDKHNKSVLACINDFGSMLDDSNIQFMDMTISAQQKGDLNTILKSVSMALTTLSADIQTRAATMQASNMIDYRAFIESHRIQMPFILNRKKRAVKHRTGFKHFLPKVVGESKVLFRPEQIYSAIRNGREMTLNTILGDIPRASEAVTARKMTGRTMTGGAQLFGTQAEFNDHIQRNMSPGFLSYFVLTYLPEIIFIGYAYAEILDIRKFQAFNTLFEYDTGVKITEPFRSMGLDGVYETSEPTGEFDAPIEALCVLCATAAAENVASVFDSAYPEIMWFLQQFTPLAGVKIASDDHWFVMDKYQSLVEAEVSLNILNMRNTMTPIQFLASRRSSSAQRFSVGTFTPPKKTRRSPRGIKSAKQSVKRSAKQSTKRSASHTKRTAHVSHRRPMSTLAE